MRSRYHGLYPWFPSTAADGAAVNEMPGAHFVMLACLALLRNRTQALLAMLGMTVGVGALVTSIALGRGAQDAINDQLRAAGANMIVVTAGNYQMQREQRGGGGIDSGSARSEVQRSGLMSAAFWQSA